MGTVEIGYHKVEKKEALSEYLNCISHAMEGFDLMRNELKDQDVYHAICAMHNQLYDVIILGELIEKLLFNKKENKDDPDNKKMCCPFHEEKTPSCVLHLSSMRFYCFGCGKEGDAEQYPEVFKEFLVDKS